MYDLHLGQFPSIRIVTELVYLKLVFRFNWLLLLELSLAGMCKTSPATLTALRYRWQKSLARGLQRCLCLLREKPCRLNITVLFQSHLYPFYQLRICKEFSPWKIGYRGSILQASRYITVKAVNRERFRTLVICVYSAATEQQQGRQEKYYPFIVHIFFYLINSSPLKEALSLSLILNVAV